MIKISIDDRALKKKLSDLQKRQLPFATALALTSTARRVQEAERTALTGTFSNPTPFTLNAYAIQPARKDLPVASVFLKDIQAGYLAPFEFGGLHSLGSKRALLVPKDVALDQYGNLPRGKLKALKGRPDVFIGTIHFKKSGETVSGVWQRPKYGARKTGGRGTKGNTKLRPGGADTGLKLLIRFGDPLPVKQHLGFEARALRVIQKNFAGEFDAAFARALETAK